MGALPGQLALRRLFTRLPGPPRCKNCAAPFSGPGGLFARALGFKHFARNPTFCGRCLGQAADRGLGGAEIELSMVFADIRGSTTLAEGMAPAEFAALLDRFYAVAVDSLLREDAMIDKFVGDEIVALFIPAFAKERHAEHAIRGAVELLKATGHGSPEGPWVPVGAGVHTGTAYVGAVGSEGQVVDITALGDPVNVAARLASTAKAGEVLVTESAAKASGLRVEGLPSKPLQLKGKSESVPAYIVTAADSVNF